MAVIKTVKIKDKKSKCGFVVINESDLKNKKDLYQEVEEVKEAPKKNEGKK